MRLPLLHYPTRVLCVDDDSLFLQTLSFFLKQKYDVVSFPLPSEVLSFFEKYSPILPQTNFLCGSTEAEKYDMLNHFPIDLKMDSFKQLRNKNERYEDISVMITDYHMNDMNGIELCRQLQHVPVKKILLTGAPDYRLAVEAFNDGIIDAFIRKDSPNITSEILSHTKRLSQEFFITHTAQLLSYLETDYALPISDPDFAAFFHDWCDKHEIREYYIIDKLGNFLCIDKEGKTFFFIVQTDRTLEYFVELHNDNKEVKQFIDEVLSRRRIPFFGEGLEGWQLEPSQWENCFYEPSLLAGKEKYYWIVVK